MIFIFVDVILPFLAVLALCAVFVWVVIREEKERRAREARYWARLESLIRKYHY